MRFLNLTEKRNKRLVESIETIYLKLHLYLSHHFARHRFAKIQNVVLPIPNHFRWSVRQRERRRIVAWLESLSWVAGETPPPSPPHGGLDRSWSWAWFQTSTWILTACCVWCGFDKLCGEIEEMFCLFRFCFVWIVIVLPVHDKIGVQPGYYWLVY